MNLQSWLDPSLTTSNVAWPLKSREMLPQILGVSKISNPPSHVVAHVRAQVRDNVPYL